MKRKLSIKNKGSIYGLILLRDVKRISGLYYYIILLVAILVQLSFPQAEVFARNDSGNFREERVKVILRNLETGNRIELPVVIRYRSDSQREVEVVDYEVTVTSLHLKSVEKWDKTYAVKATLRMEYREKYINGIRYVAVDRYSAMWQKSDNTVSIKNSYIRPGVAGVSESGQTYSTNYQYWIGTPNLNVYYYTTPPWKGIFINMQDEVGNHGVHLYSQLTRGASSWNLQFCIGLGQSALVCD